MLSRPLDVSKFGLIYAGAQKNIGAAGLVVLIVRDDLLARSPKDIPKILSYAEQAAQDSMLNTPNTFGWYLAALVFKWLKEQGGLAAMAERNRAKAALLYDYIDGSGFYRNPVESVGALVDERAFHAAARGARCGIPQGIGSGRTACAERTSRGRRHARVDLQRDAARGRAGAGRFHEGFCEAERIEALKAVIPAKAGIQL